MVKIMIKCKWCESEEIIKDGVLKTMHWGIKQNFKCKKCNRNFVLDYARNKKHPYHSEFMKEFVKEHHPTKGKTKRDFPQLSHSGRKKGSIAWNKGIKRTWCSPTFKHGKDNINFGRKTATVTGENHPNWKGGITPINHKIRDSLKMREWIKKILERDNYTCQICGTRGCHLHIHHIKSFSNFSELRFDINNGQTLCKECHYNVHTING
jgi:hypothetical protein